MKIFVFILSLFAVVSFSSDVLVSNKVIAQNSTLGGLPCDLCEKVVPFVEGKLGKLGCWAVDLDGGAVCEAAGLGPEDPLADVCVAAVALLCSEIAKEIANGLHYTPERICQLIHLC